MQNKTSYPDSFASHVTQ